MEPVLRDLLGPHLQVVFIGYNPSLRSAEVGHHFAGRSNRFWDLLYRSGLTSAKLAPIDDERLLDFGYGLTNIVHRPTKEAAEITAEEYALGSEHLREVLQHYRPRVACYVGMGVFQAFSHRRKVEWGLQPDRQVEDIIDFVAPSPSGLNRMKLDRQIDIFRELQELLVMSKK